MIFEDGDQIVFAGDSVTDMGSAKPIGEGLFDNLGHGYVRMIDNLLAACYPERRIRVTNSGVSGNTSRDLLARFEQDMWLSAKKWRGVISVFLWIFRRCMKNFFSIAIPAVLPGTESIRMK